MSDLPSNPADRQKVQNAIDELVNSKIRMQAERDLTKEICARIKDEIEYEPKKLKKLATIHYKRNLEQVVAEANEVTDDYTVLYGTEE